MWGAIGPTGTLNTPKPCFYAFGRLLYFCYCVFLCSFSISLLWYCRLYFDPDNLYSKPFSHLIRTVLVETLNPAQSINQTDLLRAYILPAVIGYTVSKPTGRGSRTVGAGRHYAAHNTTARSVLELIEWTGLDVFLAELYDKSKQETTVAHIGYGYPTSHDRCTDKVHSVVAGQIPQLPVKISL